MFRTYYMRGQVGTIVLALWTGIAAAHHAFATSGTTPTDIKRDIVLKLGPAEVSRYAVEKNLSRFLRTANTGDRLSAAAVRTWFELYIARQVMIAEALTQGYAQRPDVVRMVSTMEEHMLAQTESSVTTPLTGADLRAAYDRIPLPTSRPKPSFEEQRPLLENTLRQELRRAAKRTQFEQAIQAVRLEIAHDIAERLFRRIQLGPPTPTISEALVAPMAGERLAAYCIGDEPVILTVNDWRNRFNALFVRELPTTATQLEAGIRDLVVAEYVAREARRHGLDREPRFVEDRRNFVYYQALDLFEREQLLPQIEIISAEVEDYYRDHQTEFSRPVRAKGKLFRFTNDDDALAWLRTEREGEAGDSETIEVSRGSPLAGAPHATEPILRMATGKCWGPISTPAGSLVFFKQSAQTEPEPYAAVAEMIRVRLARSKLEALELKLAREWAPHHLIEDRLRPEEYGVVGPVEKPWRNQQ